jgi:hypothetical protein
LKSPFVKGDLGGFSDAPEIPPTPLYKKGGLDISSFDLPTEKSEAPFAFSSILILKADYSTC